MLTEYTNNRDRRFVAMLLLLTTSASFLVTCDAADDVEPSPSTPVPEQVDVDLLNGIVKGYSQHIQFVAAPVPARDRACSAQAVLRVDLSSGPFDRIRLTLDYDRARLWTLDVSDSLRADGYGSPDVDGLETSMTEMQIFNSQLRVYGNSLPGHRDASIDGANLLRVVDGVVDRKNGKLVLDIADERVEWRPVGGTGERKQSLESKFLFSNLQSAERRAAAAGLSGDTSAPSGENETAVVYIGLNRVIAGNFRFGSGLCRAVVSLHSEEADRCKSGQNQCHVDAVCYNVSKSHRCKCKPGFHGNGRTCSDQNECEKENGGCVHLCHNSHGSYKCTCFDGFQLDSGAHDCSDISECSVNNGGCEHDCVNTIGSYECRCRTGYFLASNGKNCIGGSNWCREQFGCTHHCHSTALGIRCVCRRGFRLHTNGKDCMPTCAHGNGGCQHRCTDQPEGTVCSCHDKYILRKDRRSCIASCALGNGGCDRLCTDGPDGPVCACPAGFVLDEHDRRTCHDINECSLADRGGCSHECANTEGSFECLCPPGFRLSHDQKTCRDVDECAWNRTCDHVCKNTEGSYICQCREGYELYGGTHCADVDECAMNNGGCEHSCENTQGSYRCECHLGYRLHPNKRDCVESVRCPPLRAPAKTTLDCTSRPGPGGSESITCELSCRGSSLFAATLVGSDSTTTTSCGSQTGFRWSHEIQNSSLLSCSEQVLAPGYKGRAKFMFFADHCRVRRKNLVDFEKQLSPILVGDPDSCTNDACSVTFVDLKCDTRKRYFRHLAGNRMHTLMSAEFEMNVKPSNPTDKCGVDCAREKNLKRFRRSLRRLRAMINNNREKFAIQYEGKNYEVLKKSLRAYKPRDVCEPGQVLTNKICVACSLATFYSETTGTCEPCPAGTYQDVEGQVACKPCPHKLYGVGVEGAKSVIECGEICSPGTYSSDGLTPCRSCPIGTYQSDHGRTLCLHCGPGILTRGPGATGFHECLIDEHCRPGEYYSSSEERCVACPRDSYQPLAGQNFCVDCPGDTQTDTEGAIDSSQCKDRTCQGQTTGLMGYIQSPNWPGQYPANIECTWQITPERGRRILFVIPEIHLAAQDHCRDSLVMRKTASPYSLTTYETCSSMTTPVAFTARSQTLWIYFKTDGVNSAKGFSIPYVTYNEEYQELIDDIVRDGRLYVSHQHQEVLKDAKLLSAIMEVIAQPYNYFKYANVSQTMFPESFIRLLRSKVVRFFS